MKNERELQRACLKWGRLQGCELWKTETPNYNGFPDVTCWYKGQVLLIEFKHPNGKGRLSPLQINKHEQLANVGHEVRVIDSFDAFKCLIRGWINEVK